MPIHINNILGKTPEEEQQIFTELFKYVQNGTKNFSGNHNGTDDSTVMIAYNIKDKLSNDDVMRCVFTIKTKENVNEVIDVDVVINNEESTNINFYHLLDGSEANEYYYVGDEESRTEIETVNRHLIFGDITDTCQNVSLSAFPFKVIFADNVYELNGKIGFKPTKYKWQEACGMGTDPITLGFAPDFVSTSDLFKEKKEEHFGVFIGKIKSHREVCLEINEILADCIIVNVDTRFGNIPTLISTEYKDSVVDGNFVFAEADIKADFSVDECNYYDEINIEPSCANFISEEFGRFKISENCISFGLHCFQDNPNTLLHILEKAYNEGTHFKNYYGYEYINLWFKSAGCNAIKDKPIDGNDCQLILDTIAEDNEIKVRGYDLHEVGGCAPELTVVDEIVSNNRSRTRKLIVARAENNNNNELTINVTNSDILPSFLNGDKVSLQLIGIAKNFKYFDSEEEYEEYREKNKKPKINTGEIVSINRNKPIAYIKGEVILPYINKVMYDESTVFAVHAHVWLKSNLGYFEIVHSFTESYISEDDAKKMRNGSIFAGEIYLQGDALVDDYDNGMVFDYKNNIRALRYAMTTGESYRLNEILNDNVSFVSESTQTKIDGKGNLIEYFDDINDKRSNRLISNIIEREINNQNIECIEIPFTDLPNQIMYITLDKNNKVSSIVAFDEKS